MPPGVYVILQFCMLTSVYTENAGNVQYHTESVCKIYGLPNQLTLILIKIKGSINTFHIPEGK